MNIIKVVLITAFLIITTPLIVHAAKIIALLLSLTAQAAIIIGLICGIAFIALILMGTIYYKDEEK